jgi:hypothetical protein
MNEHVGGLDIRRKHLKALLEMKSHQYRDAKEEWRQLFESEMDVEEGFPVWAELELHSSDVTGYASQIINKGYVSSPQEALDRLRKSGLFDRRIFSDWYLSSGEDAYPRLKAFARTLDYLRLLVVECILLQEESGSEHPIIPK